jgi:hypothetical protein
MNKLKTLFTATTVSLALVGCQPEVGSEHRDEAEALTKSLMQNEIAYGSVSALGKVNWYEYSLTGDQRVLTIDVESETRRADVELLVTLFRKQADGTFERLYADHAAESSTRGANVQINYPFESAETVYVSVRDLLDDEASDREYRIKISEGQQDLSDNSFESATPMQVDQSCESGRIDAVGDVDFFQFDLNQSQVIQLQTHASLAADSPVRFDVQLFDAQRNRVIQSTTVENDAVVLQPYLAAGQYTVAIADYGKDHYDLSSSYRLCALTVDDLEQGENDQLATAESLTFSNNELVHTGKLGYQGDVDWFGLSTSAVQSGYLTVWNIELQANNSKNDIQYDILNAQGESVYSVVQTAGSSLVSHHLKVDSGQYHIQVTSESVTSEIDYGFSIAQEEVDDYAELSTGDNRIDTANVVAIPNSGLLEGKISYLGDIDWYEVSVPKKSNTYQNVEFLLSGNDNSPVEYQMQVVLDDDVETLKDPITSDAILDIRTSRLIPPSDTNDNIRYYVKISDQFGKRSDPFVGYTLQVNVNDVLDNRQGQVPAEVQSNSIVFSRESDEQDQLMEESQDNLTIEHNGYVHKQYAPDLTTLAFRDPNTANSKTRYETTNDSVSITLPWISGYIDYAHDQDWYKLDLRSLGQDIDGMVTYPDEKWMYNISIELVSAATDVEYQWRIYRDGGDNQQIRDRSNKSDGFFATNGDDTLEQESIAIVTSEDATGDTFYAGSLWKDDLYIAVIDGNYVKKPSNKAMNERWDVDWSDPLTPYFLQVTLEYKSGQDQP